MPKIGRQSRKADRQEVSQALYRAVRQAGMSEHGRAGEGANDRTAIRTAVIGQKGPFL